MLTIKQAKVWLPNVPDELFSIYFEPFIPDLNKNTLYRNPAEIFAQKSYLFGGLSLYNLSHLRWNTHSFFVNPNSLYPVSYDDIDLIIRDHVQGIETNISRNVRQSKERFLWHVAHIQRAKSVFARVVFVRTEDSLRILDGNHRLAALFALGLQNDIPVESWIGES